MPTLPPRYNWGESLKDQNGILYNQLQDTYSDTASVVNTKISVNATLNNDPVADSAANMQYTIGDIWINKSLNTAYIMTSRSTNTAVT
jgi:hypothetical protein